MANIDVDDDVVDGAEKEENIDFGEAQILPVADSDARYAGDGVEQRLLRAQKCDELDVTMGFERYKEPRERTAFLLNFHPNEVLNDETKTLTAVVDYFFMTELGELFKVSMPFLPYFFVKAKSGRELEVCTFLQKKFNPLLVGTEIVTKEDLELLNHLSGIQQKYIKLTFICVSDLVKVKKEVSSYVRQNKSREKTSQSHAELQMLRGDFVSMTSSLPNENVIDIREYDVPYHIRVSIDKKIFAGRWYSVKPRAGPCLEPDIKLLPDMHERPEMTILAYDIETTKAPLKFPDAAVDQIMMISYMLQGEGGYLIVNREIVSEDIENFEYTPKPEYRGRFHIFNEENEEAVLKRFFAEIRRTKPVIFVTYNGDFFDWPFVDARAKYHNINMRDQIGFAKVGKDEYLSRGAMHMDCFKWVQRDSYLPVGSQNLKAVCKEKLCYSPNELDPEEMLPMAREQPQILANYSVSDAVATYYLYMKYVHPFIFALCTIIPMEPDSVLRKGSGTLCEALLMVQAFQANVIYPNKQEMVANKLTKDGHVLDAETYVGGHVEALESGVFRADIEIQFKIDDSGVDELIEGVERTVMHAILEEQINPEHVENYDEMCQGLRDKLQKLKGTAIRKEFPLIYHLDVAAMYPNIILTNRLQPSALVADDVCASCNFNRPQNRCRRPMKWTLREEYLAASRSEFQTVLQKLELETFPPLFPNGPPRAFHQLPKEEQVLIAKKRLAEYCRTNYKKPRITREEPRQSVVCQRENSFYVDTVRMFCDRRNELKALHKKCKDAVKTAVQSGDSSAERIARAMEVVYDSLQLAHKCILNSFYGYVMRKGARWFSMEMAGIVCHTGGAIIKRARQIIEKVGRPLELDTDGIWCALPKSFPEFIEPIVHGKPYRTASGEPINYPGAMLNVMVREEFSNDQYQELTDARKLMYTTRTENSISFEVDGPYLAMILPASKEEGKRLKKRYAVYDMKKRLKELKGFEIKRRGELQLIKQFQSSVFEAFLRGKTLAECYDEVARVANQWLDVLYTKGASLTDSELCALISENRNMSKKIAEYGTQKSNSITTARRLADFLGDNVLKDAGLNCRYIIAKRPEGAPTAERAIPLAIWQAADHVRTRHLRKWLKVSVLESEDIRDILDWDYYIERLNSTIQKIVTIPAAMQNIPNPVPRVPYPDWLHKKVRDHNDVFKQRRITDMFKRVDKPGATVSEGDDLGDMENFAALPQMADKAGPVLPRKRKIPLSPQKADTGPKPWREVLGPGPERGKTKTQIMAWLDFHRKKWAYMRQTKLHRKKKRTEHFDSGIRVGSGLQAFVRQAKKDLVEESWQVIQVAETGQPGMYKLWLLIGETLRSIQLKVHRIFYINRRVPKEGENLDFARKVNKILPRSKPVHNLYEYRVEEDVFASHENELMNELTDRMVDGIYETQIPLMFRILTTLGTICRVKVQRRREVANRDSDMLNLEDIERVEDGSAEYLQHTQQYIYFFHYEIGKRAVYALMFMKTRRSFIVLVDTVRARNMLTGIPRLFREERSRMDPAEADTLPPDMTVNDVSMETDVKKVYRLLDKNLSEYLKARHGPTLLVLGSKHSAAYWTERISSFGDIPIVNSHVDVDLGVFNEIEWQNRLVQEMIKQYFNLGSVGGAFVDSLDKSRYFRVPWGNLPRETTLFGYDLFYARQLQKSNVLLWGTEKDRPDFGGKEADDIRLIAEDEEKVLQINNPALYTTCSLHIEIDYLAVCAVLCSHHLQTEEGTSYATNYERAPQTTIADQLKSGLHVVNSVGTYDEGAQVDHAFSVLSQMVREIYRDALRGGVHADQLALHVFRWLRSPSSLMYDPALHRKLIGIMRKMLVKLLSDCRKFGCKVVYATSGWMVINTNKGNVHDALAHVTYTMDRVRADPLFRVLRISPRRTWTALLWLDASNYCAAAVNAREDVVDTSHLDGKSFGDYFEDVSFFSQEQGDEQNPDMRRVWNLAAFLPRLCQEYFTEIISGYVMQANLVFQDYHKKIVAGEIIPNRLDDEEEMDQDNPIPPVAQLRSVVQNEATAHVLECVADVYKRHQLTGGRDKSLHFPNPPGSHLSSTNPPLELAKAVCKLLSLHSDVSQQVRKLKRDLLKMIGVGEFSPVAEWKDPCISYVLPEVICLSCHTCRDLDLCKEKVVEENGRFVWVCSRENCGEPYDSREIEQRLGQALKKMDIAYHLQDLRCIKCKQIFERSVAKTCSCGGHFTETISRDSFLDKLRIFENVSRHFDMPALNESVSWILTMNNCNTPQPLSTPGG